MKNITVVVAGAPKTGKSAISQVIYEALRAKNIVTNLDDDGQVSTEINAKRLASVTEKATVSIKTVSVTRKGKLVDE